ncbi:PAS domain S-box protein [Ferruginibacter sp.]
MNPGNTSHKTPTSADLGMIFENLPGLYLVLYPDLTIAAVSNSYLRATLTCREQIVGRHLFDVFPDNPADLHADGVSKLQASLDVVIAKGIPHKMADQQYDVRRPDGVFEEKYWRPLNTPVFNEQKELIYIIHQAEDVTVEKKTEKKLLQSQKDFQRLVSGVKDYAIFLLDINGKVASWNSGAEVIKGYRQQEIVDRHMEVFYTEADRQIGIPAENLRKAIQWGRYESEGWRRRNDGSEFFANTVITALKDDAGDLYGFSNITRDITERKKIYLQLDFLSRQVNQSNDAICTIDTTLRINNWNRGAEKLYGVSAAEAIGKQPGELFRTSLTAAEFNAVIQKAEQDGYWSGEYTIKDRKGADIFVRSSLTGVKDDVGNIRGYISVSFDVTAEKQLQQQVNHLANIVEQSDEAIFSRGLDRRIISWNSGAEKLLGYSKEEAIGKTGAELGMAKISEEEIRGIENTLFKNGSWKSQRNYFHKKGRSFTAEVTGTAVKNEAGEINSMVFIIKDISLRLALEQQLLHANEMLEQKVVARAEQIIKTESRYQAIIENSGEIFFLMNDELKVIYRSSSAARITGWKNEELLQKNGMLKVHPDDKQNLEATIRELVANPGRLIHCRFRKRHKEGHYLWLEGTVINLLHEKNVNAMVFNLRDVSAKIVAEQKLRHSEENLKAIFDNASQSFVLITKEGIIKSYNKRAERTIFRNSSGVITEGKSIFSLVEGPAEDFFNNLLQKVAAGETVQYERSFTHAGGSVTWMHFSYCPVLKENGDVDICITGSDITEKKLAEQQKDFDSNNLSALINNTTDLIWSVDREYKLIAFNEAFHDIVSRITGKTPEKEYSILFHEFSPEQIERYKKYYDRAFEGEVFTVIEKDETVPRLWSELSFYPIYEKDIVIGTACFSRDISEKMQAQEALKKSLAEKQALGERMSVILNSLPATIALLDSKGVIVEVNEAWKRSADANAVTSIHCSVGSNYLDDTVDINCPLQKDAGRARRGIRQVLQGKRNEFVMEYSCDRQEQERWFRMVVTPLKEKAYEGVVVMYVDISELRRLEKERLQSKLDEQKKITKAMITGQENERNHIGKELHDNINQLLAGTRLYLNVAGRKDEILNELIRYPMELLDHTIAEIRALCAKMVTPLKDIQLQTLLQELLYKVDQASGMGTDLIYDVPGGLLSDDLKLNIYRIIQEQVNNILKHAAARNVIITVSSNDRCISISIKDDGKGFDTKVKRNGIGISNIINRAQTFNGQAIVVSSPGKGCSLKIEIPVVAPPVAVIAGE